MHDPLYTQILSTPPECADLALYLKAFFSGIIPEKKAFRYSALHKGSHQVKPDLPSVLFFFPQCARSNASRIFPNCNMGLQLSRMVDVLSSESPDQRLPRFVKMLETSEVSHVEATWVNTDLTVNRPAESSRRTCQARSTFVPNTKVFNTCQSLQDHKESEFCEQDRWSHLSMANEGADKSMVFRYNRLLEYQYQQGSI